MLDKDIREHSNSLFFDKWAGKYDNFRISRWFQYTQSVSLDQFDWRSDGRLLDIGCGTGNAVLMAASRLDDGRACGIDVSPEMIRTAQGKIPAELAGRVEFRVASAEDIPYPRHQFDFVLCTNSFHHYSNPQSALREMQRVLRPRGTLVIFENAPDLSLYTWLWDRALRIFEAGHVRYYPSRQLGDMIRQADFEEVELRVLKNEYLKYGKLAASIQVWAAKSPPVDANYEKSREEH